MSVRKWIAVPLLCAVGGTAWAKDRDHDGVKDNHDHCPDLPGEKGGQAPGCPGPPPALSGPAPAADPAAGPRPPSLPGGCPARLSFPDDWRTSGQILVGCTNGAGAFPLTTRGQIPPEMPSQSRDGQIAWDHTGAWTTFVATSGGTFYPLAAAAPTAPIPPPAPTELPTEGSCTGQVVKVLEASLVFACYGAEHTFQLQLLRVQREVPDVGDSGTLTFAGAYCWEEGAARPHLCGRAWTEFVRADGRSFVPANALDFSFGEE